MKKYRVVFGENYILGRHQYIIEKYCERISGIGFFGPKFTIDWHRFGGGYFYDNKEDAIRECDNLNNGEYVVYPNDDPNN